MKTKAKRRRMMNERDRNALWNAKTKTQMKQHKNAREEWNNELRCQNWIMCVAIVYSALVLASIVAFSSCASYTRTYVDRFMCWFSQMKSHDSKKKTRDRCSAQTESDLIDLSLSHLDVLQLEMKYNVNDRITGNHNLIKWIYVRAFSMCQPSQPNLLVHQRAIIYWEREKNRHLSEQTWWKKGYLDLGPNITQLSNRLLIKVQMLGFSVCWRWMLFAAPNLQYWYNKQLWNGNRNSFFDNNRMEFRQQKKEFLPPSNRRPSWFITRLAFLFFCLYLLLLCLTVLFSLIEWYFGVALPPRLSFFSVCWPMLSQQHWSMPFCSLSSPARVGV